MTSVRYAMDNNKAQVHYYLIFNSLKPLHMPPLAI